jgi:hypothetical protein
MVLEGVFNCRMFLDLGVGTISQKDVGLSEIENATKTAENTTISELPVEKGFWQFPLEIQQQILENLDLSSVKAFCLVNWKAWQVGIGFVWRDVKLIDCRTRHEVPDEYRPWRDSAAGADDEPGAGYDPMEGQDEHDDTPIVRKLLILARLVYI